MKLVVPGKNGEAEYKLSIGSNDYNSIYIERDDGESGHFKATDLLEAVREAIDKFFKENY